MAIYDRSNRTRIGDAINAGANDYITKPVSQRAVILSINRLFSAHVRINDLQDCYPYYFDTEKKEVTLYSDNLDLTITEYCLTAYLFFFRERIVLTSELLREAEAIGQSENSDSIERQLSRLKHRLRMKDNSHWQIQSVCDIGYRVSSKVRNEEFNPVSYA